MSWPMNLTGVMQRPKGFPTKGLVAYWKMDEADPSNIIDAWGNHNGVGSGVNPTTGKINGGYNYNHANDQIVIPHSTDFNFSDGTQNFSFSMGCWVKFNQDKDTWLFNKRESVNEFQFIYFNGVLAIQLRSNTGTSALNYGLPFTPILGDWYNIIASHNAVAGESAIYLNGIELSGTDSGVGGIFNTTTQPLQLGSAWATGLALNGVLDEDWIKKHHHTTPAEAKKIWNNGLGLTI